MTQYELLNNNIDVVVKLIKNKLAKIDMLKHIEIYEKYNTLTGTKSERYEKLGKIFNLKPDTVRKIINKLNKKIQ